MIIISYSIFIIFIPIVLTSNSCKQHKTCNECIRDASLCSWCSSENFNGSNRCVSGKENLDSWCLSNHIINPRHNVTQIENLDFNSEIGKVIQIKPQKINIDIRPGETVNFSFSFKKADNYPVDLYFLFDGSSSMEQIKNKTASKSEDIYRMMQNMTNNVLLGMGTFVDKNALPYTQFKNSTLTYSFRNRLKLTENFEVFKNTVKDSAFGSNYDVQEGTLDALAQVIVCKDEIGWRNESRKIVVVLTDQSYHAAGDGKWAGIFQPYDGKCYTVNGIYTKELEMDYPSVGIINKLASEDEITIIFAVGNDVQNIYQSLSQRISGSKMTTYKGREMAVILKSIYKQMTRSLKLKVHMKSDYRDDFQISFNPDCYKNSGNRNCRVMGNEEKKITGTIKLLRYFNKDNINVDVVFEGIKENLNININMLSSCDCETKHNSSLCNYGGTRRCGICECYQDRYGEKCSNPNDNSTCIAPDDTVICSGHGSCIRGKCLCRDGYEREFCECIRDSCLRDANDIMCSYPNGKCDCGVCKCSPGWVGDVCACPNATDCTDGNDICNNHGKCDCGNCQCQDIADWDARTVISKYCKISCGEKSCHDRQCLNLEPLALCYLKESSCKSYENVMITTEKNLTAYNASDDWYLCPKLRIDVGCYTRFIYRYSKDKYELELKIQSEFDYAETYYVIGGTCLALLILIGLATILALKYLTDKRDRREYDRFVQEAAAQLSPCDNPIYQSAVTKFNNPAFRKRSIIRD